MKTHSHNGDIYRCFDNVVAVQSGLVVAVPTTIITGNLVGVKSYCPVSWEEMWAILDTEPTGEARFDNDLFAHVPQIFIDLNLAEDVFYTVQLPEYKSTVFIHPTGIRIGISNDLIEEV
ncbi:hypothetical protein J3U75_07490 [Snodgrassella sp. B3088]|nr:hypothetical protein [Snodgrassella sp. B3088]